MRAQIAEAERSPDWASLLIGAVLFVCGSSIFVTALSLAPGPGYTAVSPKAFPITIGAGLAFFGLLLGATNIMSTSDAGERETVEPRRPAMLAGVYGIYLAALPVVGFLLATPVFVVLVRRLFGPVQWRRDLLAGLLFSGAIHMLFNYAIGVRLPVGILVQHLARML